MSIQLHIFLLLYMYLRLDYTDWSITEFTVLLQNTPGATFRIHVEENNLHSDVTLGGGH